MNLSYLACMSRAIRRASGLTRLSVGLSALGLMMTACVAQQTPDVGLMRLQPQPAIVAVATPGISIPAGATFAWLPDSTGFHTNQQPAGSTLQSTIEQAIKKNLQAMGFRFVDSASASDFSIGYAVAQQSPLNDDEIMRRFGLLPRSNRVTAGIDEYEKGSLIIYVVKTADRDVVWRSAVQAKVDVSTDDAGREHRLAGLLKDMFKTFPKADR
jgi:hypothetical protein